MFGNKTLEQRLATLTVACREALNIPEATEINADAVTGAVTALRHATTDANAAVDTAQATILQLTTERDEAITARDANAASVSQGEAQISLCRTALSMPADAAISAESLAAAIDTLVGTRAAAIAGSQGTPPLPTEPTQSAADENPVKEAYARAQTEENPAKRALLFAAARELLEKRAGKKITGLN